ncbi:MAG: amidohydrolase family protein [Cyclobacteriaceae bacterium]|nr:amidohydrolase family protein [Cyclobacteriaceae bacterium]
MKTQNPIWISNIVICLLSLLPVNVIVAQSADIILTNGKIFTADTSLLYVEALAIKGEKILAAGTNADIEKLATSQTEKIDLKGKTVVPGFNDAHEHLGWTAAIGLKFNEHEHRVPGPDKISVLDSVSRLVKKAKPNQWIHGSVGLTILNDPDMRTALDSIAPNNPVLLESWWGHGMAVNSKVLELSGIGENDPDPIAGYYGRNPSTKKLNGLINEYAQAPIWSTWVTSEPRKLVQVLRDYAQEQISLGITSVQNINGVLDAQQVASIFGEADLPLHTRVLLWPYTNGSGSQDDFSEYLNTRPAPMTIISGVKYLVDGTPLEGNALMRTAYEGSPGWHGRLNFPEDTIRSILRKAIETDHQMVLHIVGDSTFTIVLSMMKEIASPEEWRKKRVRIEHNAINDTEAYLEQIKMYDLLMMHTPIYAHRSLLKTLLKNRIQVGIAPDHAMNPFENILIVTSQMANTGENLTVEEAVIAYTLVNAYAEFAENEKGTLTVGKLADLAVLTDDIFTIPAEKLTGTKSLLTMIKGRIVYQSNVAR